MNARLPARASGKDFSFTMQDFYWLRGVASRRTGIVLGEDKYNMLYARLSRRIRSLKLNSFAAYCKYLSENEQSEIVELINAVTTNLTSFFRESHHFEHLREELIPVLLQRNRRARRIRIWSAGCSTGEEPYSIAITVADALRTIDGWDVNILATDIDSNVLATANNGVYDERRTQSLSQAEKSRWFLPGKGDNKRNLRVSDELRSMIQFKQQNLLEDWPLQGSFDAVFCRNVIIYFDPQTKKSIVEQFEKYMHEDSRLFLGHSESLFQITNLFTPLGKTVYTKSP